MKRVLVFTSIFLFGSCFVVAQSPRIGFDLGFSVNRGAYEPDEGIDRRYFGGFDGGLLVEFSCGQKLKLQPELNYSITGVELNTGASERTLKLQYLTIPVLVKLNLVKGFNLIAGPQHSILLSAWRDPSGEGVSTRIKEYFKFTDLVLVLGGEYRCRNGLFIGARYNHGLEQIAEDGVGFEMKNRYLSARIGYIFGK
jgi:hypothetical protein